MFLQAFWSALNSGSSAEILPKVLLPQAIANRTAMEQTEFLQKALQEEISIDGIAALSKYGSFGPLKELFPTEADRWAIQAGAKPEDCAAFRMERGGVRAEVVLLRRDQTYRILRCNNVKQMARQGST